MTGERSGRRTMGYAMIRQFAKRLRSKIRSGPGPVSPPYPSINSFSWRPEDGRLNFGDHLAEVVVDQLLAVRGYSRFEETARAGTLFSIGSVLHFAKDGDTVWGSGINGKIEEGKHRFNALDVRAVRGPLTAERLRRKGISVPEVYGDPALLIPKIFPNRFHCSGSLAAIFIPNLNDLSEIKGLGSIVPMVSPLRGWNVLLERIVESRLVLASSLHGLVIAEAFGIPARYVRLSEHENLFKYQDYAYGSGRTEFEYATSIEAGLEMGGMPPISWCPDRLIDSFPIDLWAQPRE